MHYLTPLTYDQQQAMMGSLNPDRISKRTQGGATLSYVEAWDIKATLVRLFGFGGFSSELLEYRVEDVREVPRPSGSGTNFKVTASARLQLTIHQLGAVYTEAAASSQTGPDLGEVMDFAIKTAESDALKRCAINLGTQLGLSLYDNGTTRDVIRRVFAPGQEWPRERPDERKETGVMTDPEVATSQDSDPTFGEAISRVTAAFSATPVEDPA